MSNSVVNHYDSVSLQSTQAQTKFSQIQNFVVKKDQLGLNGNLKTAINVNNPAKNGIQSAEIRLLETETKIDDNEMKPRSKDWIYLAILVLIGIGYTWQ